MNLVTMPPELVELDEIEKMLKSGNVFERDFDLGFGKQNV
jgi:hypothetical protein